MQTPQQFLKKLSIEIPRLIVKDHSLASSDENLRFVRAVVPLPRIDPFSTNLEALAAKLIGQMKVKLWESGLSSPKALVIIQPDLPGYASNWIVRSQENGISLDLWFDMQLDLTMVGFTARVIE